MNTVVEQRPALVDWNAVDAMFRFLDAAQGSERTLSGFAVSGSVAAAVMLDAGGAPEAWWRALLGCVGAHVPERVRKGFVANWLDVEARFTDGRFAPVVSGADEHDHERTVADFCAGFLRVLDERPDALAKATAQLAASEAVATLRRFAASAAARSSGGAPAPAHIAAALRELWAATASLRERRSEALPRRAA